MVSKNFRQRKTILGFLLVLVVGLLVWQFIPYRPGGRVQEGDYLIYRVDGGKLILYDPYTNKHRPILQGWDVPHHLVLTPGRLAFSANKNIYSLDYPFTAIPQNITANQFEGGYPISWSPNGRYLTYLTTYQDTETYWQWDKVTQQNTVIYMLFQKYGFGESSWDPSSRYLAYVAKTKTETANLWVWDTQRQRNNLIYNLISPYQSTNLEWGLNGQLAFTAAQQPLNLHLSEVFVWNGQDVINVSQNLVGNDLKPVWSPNGQLAFWSTTEENEDQIVVWDGVSKIKGVSDKNSFTYLTIPEKISYHNIAWNYQNLLFFNSFFASQIYQWDGKAVIPINKIDRVFSASWYKDGVWFALSSSSEGFNNLHILTPYNETLITDQISFEPIWSEYGLLAYCTKNEARRVLKINELDNFLSELWAGATLTEAYARTSTRIPPIFHWLMWSGETTTVKFVEGNHIIAYWSNGQSTYCSSE